MVWQIKPHTVPSPIFPPFSLSFLLPPSSCAILPFSPVPFLSPSVPSCHSFPPHHSIFCYGSILFPSNPHCSSPPPDWQARSRRGGGGRVKESGSLSLGTGMSCAQLNCTGSLTPCQAMKKRAGRDPDRPEEKL